MDRLLEAVVGTTSCLAIERGRVGLPCGASMRIILVMDGLRTDKTFLSRPKFKLSRPLPGSALPLREFIAEC